MSRWFDVKKEDISLSDDGKEIHFWLESDDDGNVYCSAQIKDVLILLFKDKTLE
jgi:hypothetical protein